MTSITDKDGKQWVLVPVEPSSRMYIRGGEEFFDSVRNHKIGSTLRDQEHAEMIYQGMLNAAPEPPIDLEQVVKDAERLDWILRKLPDNVLRQLVGLLSDTSDEVEFRAAIDAAMKEQP